MKNILGTCLQKVLVDGSEIKIHNQNKVIGESVDLVFDECILSFEIYHQPLMWGDSELFVEEKKSKGKKEVVGNNVSEIIIYYWKTKGCLSNRKKCQMIFKGNDLSISIGFFGDFFGDLDYNTSTDVTVSIQEELPFVSNKKLSIKKLKI